MRESVAPVVPLLTRWGISAEGDLVFRALAQFGQQDAAALGRALGLPERRVRAALDELVAAGAVVGAGAAGVWRAGPVPGVLAGLRRRPARQRVARRLSALADLGVECALPAGSGEVRLLRGGAGVRARLAELMAGARTEYLSMQPESAFTAEALRAAAPHDRALLAGGVTVLALGVPPAVDHEATAAHTRELSELGLRYRERPSLPTKLVLVDRRVALVPLDPSRPAAGAIEVSAGPTVQGLVAVFQRQWERGVVPAADEALSARERAVVALLAAGLTDVSVAARLEVSVRTVAYVVRGLMDRYGARNRFQLGLVLAAVGAAPASADRTGEHDDHGGTG